MTRDIKQDIEHWVPAAIRALSAYHVPDPGNCIKLDAMENPYQWPPELVTAWLERLRTVSLNRYPDPSARSLQQALRTAMRIPDAIDVLLGNGSDELIQMIIQTLAAPGRVILAPEPTFVMYRLIAQVVGVKFAGVPLTDNFQLDMDAMLEAIDLHQPAVVFLAYPNNPTGNLFEAKAIRRIIEASPGLVVVDEAYAAFASDSFMGLLGEYSNLLVLRTVSKMGLAGLRLGLLAGPPAWLGEIDKTRLPYNINVLTQVSAEFALEHRDVLDTQTAQIRADREVLLKALQAFPGLRVYPSEANFILFRTPAGRADKIFAGLRERGILIKNLHGAGGALTDCLRVTVGTPAENSAFVDALRALL
ncbi:MAG: histidinol-phosphate transaminase [Gammaproteobacteria bacterium]|nr:histidinol-phosphate transaminase [Gammaproteobacteria bacterium]MBU2478571.1 histidinol-phosphate transaminase [Gammaproteobacteria bacterium]